MSRMATADRMVRIRAVRARERMAVRALAELCGVARSKVHRALSGETVKVEAELLDAMEAALAIGTAPQPYPLPEGGVAEAVATYGHEIIGRILQSLGPAGGAERVATLLERLAAMSPPEREALLKLCGCEPRPREE